MNKLSSGERMVFWSSLALLICSFIPMWMKIEASAFGVSFNERGNAWQGFGFFPVELALYLTIIALGLTIAKMAGAKVSLPPATYLGLCGAAFVLLVLGIVTGPEGGELGGAGIEVSRGIFLFVGAVIGAAMAYGGYQHMNDTGVTEPVAPPAVPTAQ